MKLEVELDGELVDEILVKEMKDRIEGFQEGLDALKRGQTFLFFSSEAKKEKREIKKYMKALQKVLSYYEG